MAIELPGGRLGETLRRRLEHEKVVWLTTVGRDGTPEPNPVWFVWENGTVLTYNRADAARVAHVRTRPRVALNFDSDGGGGDIQVITGDAAIEEGATPPDRHAAFARKYADGIARLGLDPAGFARDYPVPIRIRPKKIRGF